MMHALRETLRALFCTEEKLTEFQRLIRDTITQKTDCWEIKDTGSHEFTLHHKDLKLKVWVVRVVTPTVLGAVNDYFADVDRDARTTPTVRIRGDAAREIYEIAEMEYHARREASTADWTQAVISELKEIDGGNVTR